jgi:hypothetical protein
MTLSSSDTSTLPEYYNDVHTIIALPRGYVVTYDYSVRHVAKDVAAILNGFTGSAFTSAATECQRFTSMLRDSGSIHVASVLTALMTTTYQAGAIGSWVIANSQVTTNWVVPPKIEVPMA